MSEKKKRRTYEEGLRAGTVNTAKQVSEARLEMLEQLRMYIESIEYIEGQKISRLQVLDTPQDAQMVCNANTPKSEKGINNAG